MEMSQGRKAVREVLMMLVAIGAFIMMLLAFERLMGKHSFAIAATPNRVLAPDYVIPVIPAEGADEKLQFEPVDRAKPLLEERATPGEAAGGAQYGPGADLIVAPESSIRTLDQPIEELAPTN